MKAKRYGVMIGKEAIVGFRRVAADRADKKNNAARSGEVRVSANLFAVLGEPSSMQHAWEEWASADHVAHLVKGKVVTLETRSALSQGTP